MHTYGRRGERRSRCCRCSAGMPGRCLNLGLAESLEALVHLQTTHEGRVASSGRVEPVQQFICEVDPRLKGSGTPDRSSLHPNDLKEIAPPTYRILVSAAHLS